MGMVLVREMCPLLSSLMDLGMRMELWYVYSERSESILSPTYSLESTGTKK